jgi:hypothetical protein
VDNVHAFPARIAFGVWANDMRTDPLPLENWPAPQMDDETVRSIIRAMDVQSRAGFNMLDVAGLLATYAWPVGLGRGIDAARRSSVAAGPTRSST